MQCIPVDVLPGAISVKGRALSVLAGDAFCGAAFGAVLIGIMVHLPRLVDNPAEHEDADAALLRKLVYITS